MQIMSMTSNGCFSEHKKFTEMVGTRAKISIWDVGLGVLGRGFGAEHCG